MPEIDRLYYTLGIKTEELEAGVARAENSFNKLVSAATSVAATIGVAFGFKEVITGITNLAMNFESAMSEVWTLTDLTKEQFDSLKQSVIELSKQGPFSVEELAKALYQTISAGVDAGNTIDFLAQAMQAAQAGATDLFTAVDGLTTIMNAWGLSMNQLSEVSDAIFVAVREGKTTFQELAQTIGTVAPTASQAGISLQEVLSAVAALTKQGIDTNRAMTSLNYAIQAIIAPTEEAKKTAQELGIQFNSAALEAQGFMNFLQRVYTAAGGNTETLSKLFGSVEALRGVFALTGNAANDFRNILESMGNSAGETQKAADKMANTLANQLARLKNSFNAIKLSWGEAITPMIQHLATIAEKFAKWAESMTPLEKGILTVSAALVGLIPVIKTITMLFAILQGVTGNWIGLLAGIGAAVGAITVTLGMMRQDISDTSSAVQTLDEDLEEIETIHASDLAQGFDNAKRKLEEVSNEAEQLLKDFDKLYQAVADYNYAQETGLGNLKDIEKKIQDILKAQPQLASAVEVVNDKYVIQKDRIKEILDFELERLRIAQEAARAELESLETKINSPEFKQYKQAVAHQYQTAKQKVETLSQLVEKYQAKLAKNPLDAVAQSFVKTYQKALETTRQELSDYAAKYNEILKLDVQKIELQQKINSLEDTHKKIQQEIQTLEKGEKDVPPVYEERIRELDNLIESQQKALASYQDTSSQAYQTDLELLKLYINEKKQLLQKSVNYLVSQKNINQEQLRSLLEQIDQLDKITEQFTKTTERTAKIDLSKITQGMEGFKRAVQDGNEAVVSSLYRQLKSQMASTLAQAYIEGNKEAIEKIRQNQAALEEEYKSFVSSFVKNTITEIKNSGTQSREVINEELNKLLKVLQDTKGVLSEDFYRKISKDLALMLDADLSSDVKKELQDFLDVIKQINPEVSNTNKVVTNLSRSSRDLGTSIQSNNEYWHQYQLYIKKNQLIEELAGKTLEEKIKLYDRIIDIQRQLGLDTDEFIEKQNRLKEILKQQNQIQKIVQESYKEIDQSQEKTLKRYQDFQLYYEIILLKEKAAGATLEEKIDLYKEIIDKTRQLGGETSEYERILQQLNKRLEEEKEAQEKALEASNNRLKVERELQQAVAKAATEKRYKGYNEMVQIKYQLEPIATDLDRDINERIEAYKKIAELYERIGDSKAAEKARALAEMLKKQAEAANEAASATAQLVEQQYLLERSMEKQLKHWQDYQAFAKAQWIAETAAGKTAKEKIEIYNRVIDILRSVGTDTSLYEEKVQSLTERIQKETEAQREAEETTKRRMEVEKELRDVLVERAKSAIEKRYSGWNEMIEVQYKLLDIAKDETRTLEERKAAWEQIAKYYEKIGDSQAAEEANKMVDILNRKIDVRDYEKLAQFYQSIGETQKAIDNLERIKQIYIEQREKLVLQGKDYSEISQKIAEIESKQKTLQGILDQQAEALESQKKAIEAAHEQQRKQLQSQADFMNSVTQAFASQLSRFGAIGELIGSVLSEMQYTVEQLEDGSWRLVSPWERMEEISANIASNVVSWALNIIGDLLEGILNALKEIRKVMGLNKWDIQNSDMAQLLENFRQFEENQKKLASELMKLPFMKLLDALTLGIFGFADKTEEKINELRQKLEATASAVAEAFGVSVGDIASSIEDALMNAEGYEDFVQSFSNSLEEMTKRALIRAFLASDVAQSAMKGVTEAFVKAVEDGFVSAEELQNIKAAQENVKGLLSIIWDTLEKLGYMQEGAEWSQTEAIKKTITEETGNRLAALLSTINLNVAQIKDKVVDGVIKVEVTNIQNIGGIAPLEYLRALGA